MHLAPREGRPRPRPSPFGLAPARRTKAACTIRKSIPLHTLTDPRAYPSCHPRPRPVPSPTHRAHPVPTIDAYETLHAPSLGSLSRLAARLRFPAPPREECPTLLASTNILKTSIDEQAHAKERVREGGEGGSGREGARHEADASANANAYGARWEGVQGRRVVCGASFKQSRRPSNASKTRSAQLVHSQPEEVSPRCRHTAYPAINLFILSGDNTPLRLPQRSGRPALAHSLLPSFDAVVPTSKPLQFLVQALAPVAHIRWPVLSTARSPASSLLLRSVPTLCQIHDKVVSTRVLSPPTADRLTPSQAIERCVSASLQVSSRSSVNCEESGLRAVAFRRMRGALGGGGREGGLAGVVRTLQPSRQG